ncbi:hypothetical protein MKW98_015896 [Papaver atlanticum]|uniref:Uncharacterized protein n=1 Tax=Papaver atlanticum TaxID=357466 RepID=A0AAD4XIN5_9MAGN|nr:hypothetical protein MKW98_015896 [Papaver atlanticum]
MVSGLGVSIDRRCSQFHRDISFPRKGSLSDILHILTAKQGKAVTLNSQPDFPTNVRSRSIGKISMRKTSAKNPAASSGSPCAIS